MTAAIKSSLNHLNSVLQNLEDSATKLQDNRKNASKGNMDLFSMPASAASNDIDAKALASRLDGAIAKVEKLLRDEGGEAHG